MAKTDKNFRMAKSAKVRSALHICQCRGAGSSLSEQLGAFRRSLVDAEQSEREAIKWLATQPAMGEDGWKPGPFLSGKR